MRIPLLQLGRRPAPAVDPEPTVAMQARAYRMPRGRHYVVTNTRGGPTHAHAYISRAAAMVAFPKHCQPGVRVRVMSAAEWWRICADMPRCGGYGRFGDDEDPPCGRRRPHGVHLLSGAGIAVVSPQ